MREKLETQVQALLKRHRRAAFARTAVSILSVCMAFCVVTALMNPAAALTNPGSITITPDTANASFTVNASSADAECTFLIQTTAVNAQLSSDILFNDQDQAVLTDDQQHSITIKRELETDGSTQYLFTLPAGETSTFQMPFVSIDSSTEGSVVVKSAWNTDLASAEQSLAAETDSVSLLLTADDNVNQIQTVSSSVVKTYQSAPLLTAVSSGTLDFGQYITGSTIKKLFGGNWIDTDGSVTEGDQIKIALEYSLPPSTITSTNHTVQYQLPYGVYPNEAQSGTVYDKGTAVGKYTISSSGLITIIFNSDYKNDTGSIAGTIQYEGTASLAESGKQNTVEFGGKGGSIVIKPTATVNDLTLAKSGTLSTDKKTINYQVTASSTNGTGSDTVTITDKLSSSTVTSSYDADSFVIKKISGSSSTVISGHSPVIAGSSFTISDLPALAAGESYTVSYNAKIDSINSADGYSSLTNSAKASTSGGKTASREKNILISKKMVTKTGGYDSASQKINWTISINPDGNDLSGYTVTDDLGGRTLNGKIAIKDSTGAVVKTISQFPYTFPSASNWGSLSSTGSYTITYQTDAPAADASLTNTVHVKNGAKDYSGSLTVVVTHQKGSVQKYLSGQTNTKSTGTDYQWMSLITLPETGLAVGESATYTDIIKNAADAKGNDSGADSHYAIASYLNASIKSSLQQYSGMSYVLICRDANGSVIANTDTTSKVKSFTVTLTAGTKMESASAIQLNYQTHADYTGMANGDTWTFTNEAKAYASDVIASQSHTKVPPLEKDSGILSDSTIKYSSGTSTLNYDSIGGKLYYRILIHTDEGTSGDIKVTDTLPAGTALEKDSVKTVFYSNDDYMYSSFGWGENEYNLTTNKIPTVTTGDGTFTISIPDGYNSNGIYRTLCVTYTLDITDTSFWNTLQSSTKDYVNSVSWNTDAVSQTTTVKKEVKNVQKTGQQVLDADGKPTNMVKYQVVINPAGNDLNENSDVLTLTDTMNAGTATPQLMPDEIHLYHYDNTKTDNLGTEISRDLYSYLYDQNTDKLTFKIPDKTPCVVVYEYYIDRGTAAGDISVTNSVSLKGTAADSTSNTVALKESTSSATAHKASITINKVDSQDYSKTLPGAKFKMDSYTNNAWSSVTAGAVKDSSGNYIYTTNSSGKIEFDLAGLDKTKLPLKTNTLYRLTETTAPEGYSLNAEPKYFVWMTSDETKDTAYMNIFSSIQLSNVSKDSILFIPNGGGPVYITNDYSSVTVKKKWMNADGTETADTSTLPEVTMQLYRQEMKADGYQVTLTPDSGSNFTIAPSTVQVMKDTQLTIHFKNSWSQKLFTVYDNGTQVGSFTFSQGTASLTLKVDKDMNLIIKCDGSCWDTIAAEYDYTAPTTMIPIGAKEAVGSPVQLSSKNQWNYTWSSVAETNSAGNSYQYTVEETGLKGYVTTYLNNAGIQTGEITVINTASGYTLPATGGTGTRTFWMLGLLLMSTSLGMWIRRHMREKDGGRQQIEE